MTNAEIESRIESIERTANVTFGGMKVRYAYLSQRGYYPDDPHKPNQDAFSITHSFGGQKTDAFFGIYDGHGRDGDRCAQFARDVLPIQVEKYIGASKQREAQIYNTSNSNGKTVELTKEQIQSACLNAHVEANRQMHLYGDLDDSLSGTTSISVYFHGRRNRITVCNVGDSRAIIGQANRNNNSKKSGTPNGGAPGGAESLKAMPLSRDQTPYRRDERIRIKATGARILSLDQIEGLEPIGPDDDDEDEADANNGNGDLELGEELDEGGDPPRVWSPHGEYPGTAFTRSLGDAIAEELGVFAEPEMLTRQITPEDRIIVLASDGVFEFLTNQSVIDICAKFSDPLEACRAVVAESYELWLQYELRTDDITMICIFIDGVESKSLAGSYVSASSRQFLDSDDSGAFNGPPVELESPGDDTVDAMLPMDLSRPVRNRISKEKSKQIQQMKIKMASEGNEEDMADFDISKLYTEKTADEKARISEAIHASVMFQNITEEQREMIYGVMEPINVKKGTWVIKQGTVGDRFYIVDTGKFEVRIVPDGETDQDGSGGNVVHIYEGSLEKRAHPSFGELALMYSAPRAASIIAKTDGHLWALHRFAFRQVLALQSGRQELISTLSQIEFLKNLKNQDISNLAAAMEEVTFGRGDMIVEQGRSGDCLFVISKGTCEYLEKVDGQPHNATLKGGDFFGEEVLVDQKQYSATVMALQTTTCWRLSKSTMKQTVGSLKSKRKSKDKS